MKKNLYLTIFTISFILSTHTAFSQTASVDTIGDNTKGEKKSSLKFGLNYLSNAVLLGRADTIRTSLLEPEIKYTFAPGIYVTGNLEYVPNRKKNRVDGGSLGLGYDFDIGDNLSGGVSYTKLFYSSSSTQIGSAISHSFNANLDYNIGDIITPSISVDYNIIKQGFGNDVLLNAGLNHDFTMEGIFSDDDEFALTPTATVNAGTQNFYDAYFSVKKYKVTQKGQAKEAKAKALLAANAAKLSQFTLLDYELSMPIEYKTGLFIFSFTPTYAIARNKLPAQITSTMVNTNKGIFYFQLGVVVKI
jgi:hypothetical protein